MLPLNLSSTTSTLLRLAGWSYLPDFLAHHLLRLTHTLVFPLLSPNTPIPKRGTPTYALHYRLSFSFVVLSYLTYNLLEASSSTPLNFYQILGVGPDAGEKEMKDAFRAFAKRNHPDRPGVGKAGEALFVTVRDAFEVLKNPVARFAYDRFGPNAMTWRDCVTESEFLWRGLMQASGFYIGSFVILLLMSATMARSPVAFWRYLLLLTLLAFEFFLHQSYTLPSLFTFVFPHRVAFQHILFLHQLFVFCSVALTRVVPVLFAEYVWTIRPEDPRTYAPLLQRLMAACAALNREVSGQLQTELHALSNTPAFSFISPSPPQSTSDPSAPTSPLTQLTTPIMTISKETLSRLMKEMQAMVVEHNLQLQPALATLWKAAVEKRSSTPRADTASGPGQAQGEGKVNIADSVYADTFTFGPDRDENENETPILNANRNWDGDSTPGKGTSASAIHPVVDSDVSTAPPSPPASVSVSPADRSHDHSFETENENVARVKGDGSSMENGMIGMGLGFELGLSSSAKSTSSPLPSPRPSPEPESVLKRRAGSKSPAKMGANVNAQGEE